MTRLIQILALLALTGCGTDDSGVPSPSASPSAKPSETSVSEQSQVENKAETKEDKKSVLVSESPAPAFLALEKIITRQFETDVFIFNLHDMAFHLPGDSGLTLEYLHIKYPVNWSGSGSYSKVIKKKPNGTTVECWFRVAAKISEVGRPEDEVGLLQLSHLMTGSDAFCGSTTAVYSFDYRITAQNELILD